MRHIGKKTQRDGELCHASLADMLQQEYTDTLSAMITGLEV